MSDRRRVAIAAAALAAVTVVASHPPSADLRILTHDARDAAPRRFQAAVDLGFVAVSVLYTWTQQRIVS